MSEQDREAINRAQGFSRDLNWRAENGYGHPLTACFCLIHADWSVEVWNGERYGPVCCLAKEDG